MKVLLASTGSDISSGAVKCLLELSLSLINNHIDVLVTIPKRGNIEEELKKRKIPYRYIHEYHSWYTSEKHKKNKFLLKKILNYKAFFQMRNLLKKEKIDIVHENALTAYVAAWAAESLKIPVVWHIREFMEEDLNISFYNKNYSIKKINKSSQLISISKSIANKWNKVFSAPMTVIYDGIPISNYLVRTKKRNASAINIIIYGRIVEPKGQLFFFNGMHNVLKKLHKTHKIKIYWAGSIEDKEYFDVIIDFINKNNLNTNVEYLGEISNVKKVLKDMDIVTVCSKQEGFGRVTVESMLAGCIVLGADTGATKEIIRHGDNGFLYKQAEIDDFVDKMIYIIENIESSRMIAEKAKYEAISKFSIDQNVEKIMDVYNGLLQKK